MSGFSGRPRRDLLSVDRTYYVRTDGSDSNNGLANTSGGAFLTKQKAMDIIAQTLDLQGYTVTVQIADGTYTGGVQIKNWVGGGIIIFQGNSGTPANVLINVTGNCFDASFGLIPGIVRIKDMKLQASLFNIISRSPGRLQFTNIVFGTGVAHVVSTGGGLIEPYGTYSIIAAASYHWLTAVGGTINTTASDLPAAFGTVTLSGTLTFANAFAEADAQSRIYTSSPGAFTGGTITGVRYVVTENSLIRTGGGGAGFFPGNSSIAPASGGQYT
jgi:hypothetical protein